MFHQLLQDLHNLCIQETFRKLCHCHNFFLVSNFSVILLYILFMIAMMGKQTCKFLDNNYFLLWSIRSAIFAQLTALLNDSSLFQQASQSNLKFILVPAGESFSLILIAWHNFLINILLFSACIFLLETVQFFCNFFCLMAFFSVLICNCTSYSFLPLYWPVIRPAI